MLHTYVRLQIHILYNEIQAKINDGNILSSMLNINLNKINYVFVY